MALVPGSGARITPIFNDLLGVDSVIVEDGGSGYDANRPPLLRIGNAGIPSEEAKLRPVIKDGKIVRVDVIDPGYGYDPLRIEIQGSNPTTLGEGQPFGAQGKVFIKKDLEGNLTGEIEYIQLSSQGDSYFGETTALIRGGGGEGATAVPITGFVTGLSIINEGREYLPNNTVISLTGGTGSGAKGVVEVDEFGVIERIRVENPGEFYETDPLVLLVGGGGSGAKAVAKTNLGELSQIQLLDRGGKYTSEPEVVFARQTKLSRKVRNRQSYNSSIKSLTGLIKDVQPSDTDIFVESTGSFPGSGSLFLNKEIINYTGKTATSFTGCNRGINFRYDQKLILDVGADDEFGISRYQFQVSDRVNRTTPNASNKIARVYDWNPETKSLYITFEIDELAFIDGGRANEKSNVIAFSGGISGSATTDPHRLIDPSPGDTLTLLTTPITIIQDIKFQDDYLGEVLPSSQLFPGGDGFPDLYNTGTAYEGEISLDGGISSSLYGIEENTGGTNTTLFQVGEIVRDSTQPPLEASVVEVTGLTDGERHISIIKMRVVPNNSAVFTVGGNVIGQTGGIESTTVFYRTLTNGSWLTTGQMETDSRLVTVSNTIDLEVGMIIASDVIPEGSTISRIINSTVIEISNPVLAIIGNKTRPIVIRMQPEPDELEENPLFIQNLYYLYVKSAIFPDPIINYEYQFNEVVTGTGGGNATVKSVEYFSLVKDETT
jgi:hypothetical protein